MKKLLSLLIAALMLMSCCFAATESDYLGTWLGDGMDLTFNDDNSVTVVSDGSETPSVWYEQNGKFFLLGAEMTVEGNLLTVSFASGDRVFTRDGEAPVPVTDPAPAPASDLDLTAYYGDWYYESYTLTIGEDGTATMEPGSETVAYTVENGALMIDGMPCVINEDGALVAGDADYQMVFTREKPEISVPENAADYTGAWTYTLSLGDEAFVMTLVLNEDGTGMIDTGDSADPLTWYEKDGQVYVDGTPAVLGEDGTLTLQDADWPMTFVRETADPASTGIIGGADGPTAIYVADDLSAYYGDWYYESYTLTIGEDGTATMAPTGESMEYTVEDGILMIDGMPCVIDENGALVAGDEDYQMVFTREKPEISVPENTADYAGTWVYTLSLGGESLSMTLVLNEDGSGTIDTGDGEPVPLTWYEKDGQVLVDGAPAVLGDDGSLTLQDDAWPMTFVREGAAVTDPAADPEPASDGVDVVGKTFVGTSATASGVEIDMSLMGRYSVTFYEDGKADMEIAGIAMPIQCTYEIGENEVTVDYVGMKYVYTFTDTGLTMNYFDTMLINYEAE